MSNSYFHRLYKRVAPGETWSEVLVPVDALVSRNDAEMAAYIANAPAADLAATTPGVGYMIPGTGGTVTQATSKATGFTLSTLSGQITTAADALATGITVGPVWTNTVLTAADTVIVNHVSGGTIGAYTFNVQPAAGSATLNITNRTVGSSLSEALVLNFAVIRGRTT